MKAHIERLARGAVIRVVEDEYGSPYTWACSAEFSDDGKTVELLGVIVPPSLSDLRAITKTLRAEGVERIKVTRRRDDGKEPEIHYIEL